MHGVLQARCALVLLAALVLLVVALPAQAQGFSVAFNSQWFTIAPGGSFSGAIEVSNPGDRPAGVRVYLGDLLRVPGAEDYQFDEEGGREPRSLLPWMTFTPDQMTLEPGEKRTVLFEVQVPEDPSLEGSYWAVVFVEGMPTEEKVVEEAKEVKGPRIGIRTVFRYAVKVYATIEGTEQRAASFTDLKLEQADGGFDAIATMENRGNVCMKPKVWLELRDTSGETVFTREHVEKTVLPESTLPFKFELRSVPVPPGEYLLMIIADYGAPKMVAAQARVSLTKEQSAPPVEESSEAAPPAEETGGSESGS